MVSALYRYQMNVFDENQRNLRPNVLLSRKSSDQKMRSAKRSGPPQTSSFFKLCRFLDFEKRGDVFRIESRLVNIFVTQCHARHT